MINKLLCFFVASNEGNAKAQPLLVSKHQDSWQSLRWTHTTVLLPMIGKVHMADLGMHNTK